MEVLLMTVFANISPLPTPALEWCNSVLQPWAVVAAILGMWSAPELFQCKVCLLSTESSNYSSQLSQFCTKAGERLRQSFLSDLLQRR